MSDSTSHTSRRIAAWHHTCCNTVRWSGHRLCDLCGTQADYYAQGVPINEVMARLHSQDAPVRVAAPQQRPTAAPPVRPPGARPHRPGPEDEEGTPPKKKLPSAAPARAELSPGVRQLALGAAIVAAVAAVLGAVVVDLDHAPVLPLLIAVSAMLVVLVVPARVAREL